MTKKKTNRDDNNNNDATIIKEEKRCELDNIILKKHQSCDLCGILIGKKHLYTTSSQMVLHIIIMREGKPTIELDKRYNVDKDCYQFYQTYHFIKSFDNPRGETISELNNNYGIDLKKM